MTGIERATKGLVELGKAVRRLNCLAEKFGTACGNIHMELPWYWRAWDWSVAQYEEMIWAVENAWGWLREKTR